MATGHTHPLRHFLARADVTLMPALFATPRKRRQPQRIGWRRAGFPCMQSVTVLAVASSPVLAELRRILAHSRWDLFEASSLAETFSLLRRQPLVVLISEAVLPDGGWQQLLRYTLRFPVPPPLVVVAGRADESLWMEVLNRGGYNLLSKPFQDQEVFQVLSHAWMHLREMAASTPIV
jgi:FixJ family two-component response regulator